AFAEGFSSGRRDSNSRPHDPEPCALPNCATPRSRFVSWTAGARENVPLMFSCQLVPWNPVRLWSKIAFQALEDHLNDNFSLQAVTQMLSLKYLSIFL